jgi:hypothetical protein
MKNPLAGILILIWCLLFYLLLLYSFNIRLQVSDTFESQVPDFSTFFSNGETATQKPTDLVTTNLPVKPIAAPDTAIKVTIIDSAGADSLYPLLGPQNKVDTSQQRVLLVGDSMAESLFYPFSNFCRWSNFQFKLLAIRGTSSPFWAKTDTLVNTIRRFKPTLVLFTLGANEITVPYLTKRKRLYQQIIHQFDTLPYIYIGTPVWTADTTYTQMMQELVPADQLFISQGINLSRQRDGAHPNVAGARVWADSIARWMVYHSKYPVYFQLRKPNNFKNRIRIEQPKVSAIQNLGKDTNTKRKPQRKYLKDSTSRKATDTSTSSVKKSNANP